MGVIGLTMLLLVLAANALTVHYARGVLQAAVEEGARQGLAAGPPACSARAAAVVGTGLGAIAGGVAPVDCRVTATGATATMTATFEGWLPGWPAQTVDVRARVHTPPADP